MNILPAKVLKLLTSASKYSINNVDYVEILSSRDSLARIKLSPSIVLFVVI